MKDLVGLYTRIPNSSPQELSKARLTYIFKIFTEGPLTRLHQKSPQDHFTITQAWCSYQDLQDALTRLSWKDLGGDVTISLCKSFHTSTSHTRTSPRTVTKHNLRHPKSCTCHARWSPRTQFQNDESTCHTKMTSSSTSFLDPPLQAF